MPSSMNSSPVYLTSKVSPAREDRPPTALGGCSNYTLVSTQGKNLYAREWTPPPEVAIRGIVFLCHGYNEHLAFYEPLAMALADRGLLAFGHDHVGHGRSEGVRCYVADADEYVEDVLLHVARTRKVYPHHPCYIVGHSMGGMVSIRAVLNADDGRAFSGVVLMGPLILLDPKEASPFRVSVARVLAWLFPNFPVGRLRTELVTRDEEMLRRLSRDELAYQGAIRARWATACINMLLRNRAALSHFSVPFLILHGERDSLCALEGSRLMLAEAPVKDKSLKVFPEALHHLYLETPDTRQEAITDTVEWIAQRLPPAPVK